MYENMIQLRGKFLTENMYSVGILGPENVMQPCLSRESQE